MRAILSTAPGGPRTLELADMPVPQPAADEVRIAVKAVGINYPDLLIIDDRYQYKPQRPFAPGGEVAGVVEAVGDGVATLRAGDRILAFVGWGGLSESVCVAARKCHRIPNGMPFDEAAAFILTYGTSYHALKQRACLASGETLVVLGAAGGVGLAAVELGKAMGARVVAAASSETKLEATRRAGADHGLIYTRGPLGRDGQKALSSALKEACGKRGADVVYDAVGGEYAEPALRAIAWEGRYLVVGFPAGIPAIPLNLPLLKGCDIRGVFWGDWTERNPELFTRDVAELFELYSEGKVRPHIHKRFALEDTADALDELASREVIGKVVVTVG